MSDSSKAVLDEAAVRALAERLGECLVSRADMLACAESCSGGWLAKIITDLPGSSAWFAGSVVSYSNAFKRSLLGVPESTLTEFGAVSDKTVQAMCEGLLRSSEADVVVSISGVAGPGGGTDDKPVGLVWLAWSVRDQGIEKASYNFSGNREAVRLKAVAQALENVLNLLDCS